MWCAKCQSEVAVEARPNSQRLHCATCGTEISPRPARQTPPPGAGKPPQATGATAAPPPASGKNPHELLARWAGNQMFDPYGPIVPQEGKREPAKEARPQPAKPAEKPAAKPAAKSAPPPDETAKIRIDPAFTNGWSEVPSPHIPGPSHSPGSRPPKLTEREMPAGHRAHGPSQLQGPHFNPARLHPPPKTSTWVALFGQGLAYVGAATLTGGAGMVMISYLGGPAHYAPTGWFTTTVGQMLLFLGVVTLVSAGMEQTTVEVTKRIDTIGEQLERMENSTHAHAAASGTGIEAELRAEIAQLRQQLGNQGPA